MATAPPTTKPDNRRSHQGGSHVQPTLVPRIYVRIVAAAGCGSDDDASLSTGPTRTVVTFEMSGAETYKVEFATGELIAHAKGLLAGENILAMPNGLIIRDGSAAGRSRRELKSLNSTRNFCKP